MEQWDPTLSPVALSISAGLPYVAEQQDDTDVKGLIDGFPSAFG
jgi:hypothetical protein